MRVGDENGRKNAQTISVTIFERERETHRAREREREMGTALPRKPNTISVYQVSSLGFKSKHGTYVVLNLGETANNNQIKQ